MRRAEYRRTLSFRRGHSTALARRSATLAGGCAALALLLAFGHPAFRHVRLRTKQELDHLLAQHLTRVGIGEIEPIVVDDQAGLVLPHIPRLLRDFVVDALPKLAREWRLLEARQLAP